MKRKVRKGCLSVLFVIGLLSGLTAQRVIVDFQGARDCPVIDLSELDAVGAVLTREGARQRRTDINKYTLRPDDWVPSDNKWNQKMSPLFQVMRKDLSGVYTWVEAYNACKAYTGTNGDIATEAGQWRLPTLRELQMIFVLHPQLRFKGGLQPFETKAPYWSCTPSDSFSSITSDCRYVSFSNGQASRTSIKTKHMVRCVRDL